MLLEEIMKLEVPKVIQTSTGPSMHTSPFRPENDRFWSICSEAGIKLRTHLATVTRYGVQGLDWNEEEVMLGDMDAFQWVFYYGDRPAMETVGAAILQGWFARFPKMQLLLSEQGTVWVPYTVRKLDHAFLMGRRATWGKLDGDRAITSRTTASWLRSPRRTSTASWRWWARSPSRSGRTSHTARASRSPRCTSGSSETSTTPTPGRSCATTWRGSSISRSRAAPIMRIGVFFPTKEYQPLDETVARMADIAGRGFSSLWLPQSSGFDALTVLALVGQVTSDVELGTSVVPTYPRHPLALAAQALTVNAATHSRLVLGIGLSHRMAIEGGYGYSYDRPARHMREYLDAAGAAAARRRRRRAGRDHHRAWPAHDP